MEISAKQLMRLLSDDDLTVQSEERVFEAALAWIKFDVDVRQVCYKITYISIVPVYTKTVDSIEGMLWLASQTSNILCYLPPSYLQGFVLPCVNFEKMTSQFASVTSEEIIQINDHV